jgi:hypothetical protein
MIEITAAFIVGAALGAIFAWPYAFQYVWAKVLPTNDALEMAQEALERLGFPVEYVEELDVDSDTPEE